MNNVSDVTTRKRGYRASAGGTALQHFAADLLHIISHAAPECDWMQHQAATA